MKAITVAILNQKGGAGKTTIATHLAHGLHLANNKVLLVDSDPQGSARDWNAASDGELLPVVGLDRPTLDKDIKAVSSGYDWIIIDGAPQAHDLAISAIKAADIILIPVQPSPYDIWATSDLVDLVKQRQEITDGQPKAAFIVSRRIQGTKIAGEVLEALEGYELPIFKSGTNQRVIYANSATGGTTALSDEPNGPAANEIKELIKELENFSHE